MANASGIYYESRGDALVSQGRDDEARGAYLHAMGDYTRPMDLESYKRCLGKLTRIDGASADAAALGHLGGRSRSPAKAAAARANGAKGGRPRKSAEGGAK